tara:strand:+ start:341 stop:532 length:192 start_codon:yes stop_codon:yes gene_type:complete
MKYKFTIKEDTGEKVETTEKEGMSFKKILKSLVEPNPKWTGLIVYENKKGRYVTHNILNGKKV